MDLHTGQIDVRQLGELKARKAKFGFKSYVATHNFIALAHIVQQAQMMDSKLLFELNFNMNANEFKLYTNDATTAQFIRDNFVVSDARLPAIPRLP